MMMAGRRDVHRMLLAGLATGIASSRAAPALAQSPANLDFVLPELRPAARQILQMSAAMPAPSLQTLPAARAMMEKFARPPLPAPVWSRRVIRGAGGQGEVAVFVINSDPAARRPAILHTHGGGFISGEAAQGVAGLQTIAQALDCTIVSVEYHLAPEATWVQSVAETYAALEWLHDGAASLGIDPARIAVMGESAGGGHAALLALKARDIGKVPLVAQILVYPMLDDRTGTTVFPTAPIGTLGWNAAANHFGWQSFLGQAPGTDAVPAQAVPARRADLAGLAPAFIGVGSIDLFVDEDMAYARRLIDAGVQVQLEVVPGAFHGFDGIAAETRVAKDFTAAKLGMLRRAFDR